MIPWWLPHLARGPTPDFNNGLENDFNNDVSKQIRLCAGQVHLHQPNNDSCGIISLDMLTSLGQSTIRLRRYGWNTSKEVYGEERKKKKKKGKERYVRLNAWKTWRSVC